jgi:hypothetical protein
MGTRLLLPGDLDDAGRTSGLAANDRACRGGLPLVPGSYNSDFRPFQSPVPFLFVRHTVLSDWKFFVDDDALLDRWPRHFGPSATATLVEQLRRVPWRTPNNTA